MSNSSSNVHKRNLTVIIASYLAIVALLLIATKIGIDNLESINERLRIIVQENNVKAKHMDDMRDAIRERIIILHTMTNLDDPFEIDDAWQIYSEDARRFISARDALMQMDLTDEQKQQLEEQRQMLGQGQSTLDQIIEDIRSGEVEAARTRILQAQELNDIVIRELQEMRNLQQLVAEQSMVLAATEMHQARENILTLIVAAVFVASIILIIVVTIIHTQSRTVNSLFSQLEEANADLEHRVETRTNELMQTRSENMRMSAELGVTHQLQQMLLPRQAELAAAADLEIAATMQPAEEAGGDYYDVLQYDGKVIIGVGDVTGHGLESSVVMLMAQTAVRTLAAGGIHDPVRFLTILNRAIYDNLQRIESYKNLTFMISHYDNGELMACGQHEEMLLVRKDQNTVERIDTIDLGFPIGLEGEIEDFLKPHAVHLDPGDTIILYTDGIPEAEDASGNFYGMERLCTQILNHVHEPTQVLHDRVLEDVYSHIADHQIYDDITLMVIRRKD